jgi:hypothetical protein
VLYCKSETNKRFECYRYLYVCVSVAEAIPLVMETVAIAMDHLYGYVAVDLAMAT